MADQRPRYNLPVLRPPFAQQATVRAQTTSGTQQTSPFLPELLVQTTQQAIQAHDHGSQPPQQSPARPPPSQTFVSAQAEDPLITTDVLIRNLDVPDHFHKGDTEEV
ncbi:hypothetical protein, partial [Erythrobacter sp. YJ-T3-07]|uniref:hypothetical protein n=1 Tax=Erythrobacter sp. YJ-T3-07 TaxID=2793063 RepID=UPI001F3EC30C